MPQLFQQQRFRDFHSANVIATATAKDHNSCPKLLQHDSIQFMAIQSNPCDARKPQNTHSEHTHIPWSAFTILKGRIFIRSLIYSHFQSSTSPTMSSPSLSSSPSLKSYIEKWPPACASVVCYLVYVTPPSAPLLFIAHCWNVFLTREIDKAMK